MLLFVASYVGQSAGFDLLGWLIGVPTEALIRLVLTITGQSE